MQSIACKYICNHSIAQIFDQMFSNNLKNIEALVGGGALFSMAANG